MFSLTNFTSHIEKNGIARSSRFIINIHPVNFYSSDFSGYPTKFTESGEPVFTANVEEKRDITIRCSKANIPGIQMLTNELNLYGAMPVINIPQKRKYDLFAISFINSADMYEKKYFDKWMDKINDFQSNNIGYYNDITKDITVKMYSDKDNEENFPQYEYTIKKAFPANIENIQLDWANTNEATMITTDVNFYFEQLVFTHVDNNKQYNS